MNDEVFGKIDEEETKSLLSNNSKNKNDTNIKNKLNESEFDEDVLDNLYTEIGYGYYQIKQIILTFLGITFEGIHFYMLSALIVPIKEYYKISDYYLDLLSALVFFGFGVGSFISGIFLKYITRKTWIISGSILTSIFQVFWCISESFNLICIYRFFIGMTVGMIVPSMTNILAEVLPIKYRGIVLCSVWTGFNFGQIIDITAIWFLMPNFESTNVNSIFYIILPYQLSVSLFFIIFLDDSPRNLLLLNKNNEAYESINNMIKQRQISDKERRDLSKKYSLTNNEKYSKPNTETIESSNKFNFTFIILIIAAFLGALNMYGPMFIENLELKALYDFSSENILNNNTINFNRQINDMYIIAICSSLGDIFSGVLSETKFFGRRGVFYYTSIIGSIVSFLIIINASNFEYYSSIQSNLAFGYLNLFNVYASEVIPTRFRDIGVGMVYTFMRIGGFFSQYLYNKLFHIGDLYPYYLNCIVCLLLILTTYLIPIETRGQPLDKEKDKY